MNVLVGFKQITDTGICHFCKVQPLDSYHLLNFMPITVCEQIPGQVYCITLFYISISVRFVLRRIAVEMETTTHIDTVKAQILRQKVLLCDKNVLFLPNTGEGLRLVFPVAHRVKFIICPMASILEQSVVSRDPSL